MEDSQLATGRHHRRCYSMIHAQEGTRGLLQKLFKQEECSSSDGDGLDETHNNDKVVTEKDGRTTPASSAFHQECFAQLQGGDVPILYEDMATRDKKEKKSEPLTPECQTFQASEDTASSSLEEGCRRE